MKNKLKTNKSASKRFKITGTGKVLRYKAGKRHLLSHISARVKLNKRSACEVSSSDMDKVRALLPGI